MRVVELSRARHEWMRCSLGAPRAVLCDGTGALRRLNSIHLNQLPGEEYRERQGHAFDTGAGLGRSLTIVLPAALLRIP